jgi:uncharacterized protein (DUF1697 family)
MYIALLRGINVSGQKTIRMAELKESFAALGHRDIRNYLQSGNIVFDAARNDTRKIGASIRARVAKDFGHDVDVLVVAAREFDRIASSNPLIESTARDETLFHCTFLFEPVSATDFAGLDLPARVGERAVLSGSVIYLHCPHGYGRTKLNNGYFERALQVPATTRNWRTVRALHAMCAARQTSAQR